IETAVLAVDVDELQIGSGQDLDDRRGRECQVDPPDPAAARGRILNGIAALHGMALLQAGVARAIFTSSGRNRSGFFSMTGAQATRNDSTSGVRFTCMP